MMVEISMIRDLIAIFGVIAGFSYYVMVLRNQNKTRQIQFLMQLSDNYTEEISRKGLELLNMQWENHDDFEKKYGSDNNPDNFALRVSYWQRFNTQGMLLMNGLVTSELLFGSGRVAPMFHWKKFGSVIKEIRTRYSMPLYCTGFEFLAKENKSYLEQKGYKIEIPDTYYQYIPDKK